LEQILQKRTRSILEELSSMSVQRDRSSLIESRANNVISSAINLLNYIRENYDAESAAELERRLLNSIRTQDPNTGTMSKFVKQWDLRRKNSWRTAFPELVEYLKLDQ
jgi:hypothetical protein